MDYDNPQFVGAVKKIVHTLLDIFRHELKQQNESIDQNKETDRRWQYPPVSRAELHIDPSDRYKQETKDARESIFGYWKAYAEILGIIILGLYASVTALQWHTMRGQLTEMQSSGKQTDQMLCLIRKQLAELHRQAIDTHNLAGAAANQVAKLQAGVDQTSRLAKAAEDANQAARNAIEAQNRPWVGVEELPQFVDAKNPLKFDLVLHNYGQSPAIVATRIHFRLGWWVKPEIRFAVASERGDDGCKVDPYPSQSPSTQFSRFSVPIFQGETKKIPAEVERLIRNSDPPNLDYAYLLGCVAYTGNTGGPYKLLLMYYLTYDASHSVSGIELVDIRTSFDPKRD